MMMMMMMMLMRGIDYRGTTQSAKSGSDLAGLLGNGQGVCFGGYDVRQVSFKRYYSVSEEDDDEERRIRCFVFLMRNRGNVRAMGREDL